MATMTTSTRIALIHALEESVLPARAAFARAWPDAFCFDLLDTSLAVDLADAGKLDDAMMRRFKTLADYVLASEGKAGSTQAILFTCSAFGPAIDAVKRKLPVPVLRPNEAAFEQALTLGSRIALAVTFGPSLPALSAELEAMAQLAGSQVQITPVLVEGALAALKAGDGALHDRLVVEALGDIRDVDVIVLGQFSLARAADPLSQVVSVPVLTTPGAAVQSLREKLGATAIHS